MIFTCLQQAAFFDRIIPVYQEAMKALHEILGDRSTDKAVEEYAPFRPGDTKDAVTPTPKKTTNKLARVKESKS